MKTNRLIKFTIVIFFSLGLGCSEDFEDVAPEQTENSSLSKTFYTKNISLDDIPEIADFFESKTKKGVFSAKGEDQPIFDVKNILEVVDTLQNRNYSFSFLYEDTPKTELYNLIIGVDSTGQKSTPIVLKYTSFEESYKQWAEHGFDFRYFSGKLTQYRYTDFFESGLFAKSDCPEHLPNGDPSPCYESDISNGSVGTGSGGGASSGGGSGGGKSGGCSYNSYFHACGGSNQYTTHGSQGCGGDGGGSYWVLEVNCPNGNDGTYHYKTTQKSDCEDCESGPSGGVGVNYNPKSVFLLENELEQNPFVLIDIDCDQIKNWKSLAQHTPPNSVKDKVKNLQDNHESILGDWDIQELGEAGGKIINLDYFSVNITKLPINPDNGQRFSPEDFIKYFRRNINDFVDGTKFEPYCEISAICHQETNLWNSSNPLGALIKLDISLYNGIGGNTLGNDGVVICADYNSNYWRFMTMEAPYDSSHPVTGTRQFGIEQMPNGSYNIYVRGVDRFSSSIQEMVADAFLDNQFQFADNLWETFQRKTNSFINTNGGTSTIINPVQNRPNWEKVKEVLEGKRPASDLGCY